MKTEHSEEFFVWWLIATIVSIVLGVVIANEIIGVIQPLSPLRDDNHFITVYLMNPLLAANITGACIGLFSGLGQWLLLRTQFTDGVRWWVIATAVGWYLGFVAKELLFIKLTSDRILSGLLAAAILGCSQSVIVRKLQQKPVCCLSNDFYLVQFNG
jgi:hypothetical protein